MSSKVAILYDEDFHAWTQEQAKALRTHFRGDNRIDVEHLAEEIEDLGKSELHAVESYIENVIEYLLKLDYSGWAEARNHWRAEIDAFRGSIERKITPQIRQQVERSSKRSIAALGARQPARCTSASRTSSGGFPRPVPITGRRSGTGT